MKWNVGVPADKPLCEPFGRASVIAAIESMKRGEVICVTDDESRENEGDLIMAGEFATPETVGFIVRYTSGVICCSVRRRFRARRRAQPRPRALSVCPRPFFPGPSGVFCKAVLTL
jgi:hypothetical protein